MTNLSLNQPTDETIFSGYAPNSSFYDEIYTREGQVRPSWAPLLQAVDGIGRTELHRRWLQGQAEIQEAGIAYNVYDESVGVVRPWELDLLPHSITPDEWAHLSAGLVQRASLLNRILADLYGPQKLLESGLLPAEWLYSHPGFKRANHGHIPHGDDFLHLYAADLARAPDGRWWVVGDRTDAPLGMGYALENRIVSSRMLPAAFRNFHVERLAPFFKTLQTTLRELAPAHKDNPRIVLLSQGPRGPNYFEDAYLARYLGYTLVEGGDLAVRDNHVYLKTLGGLLPVDVIFRRMSDEYCDPLEMRGIAGFGVPGLLQAVRLGHVAIANPLGSSLVESPSLLPFLPGISRAWDGKELLLPSVATWWCGQESARVHVGAQIDQGQQGRLSIRSAFRHGRKELLKANALSQKSAAELKELLATNPNALIAQEAVKRSTSPAWYDSSSVPWHVALRVYLVAELSEEGETSYQVMPGGLMRLERESAPLDHSILGGRLSKDVWVQSLGPVKHVSLLAKTKQALVLRRSGAELPSRVADNLFWFGRRIERAQGACRLLRPVVTQLLGEGEIDGSEAISCMIHCLAGQGQIEPGFAVEGMKDRLPTIANILPSSVLDEHQLGSVRASVMGAHRNASLVRDRLSLDIWRIVHDIERQLYRAAESQKSAANASPPVVTQTQSQTQTQVPSQTQTQAQSASQQQIPASQTAAIPPFGLPELDELLDDLLISLSALDGMIYENMTRAPAWRFLDLGRRLERSLSIVSIVQSFDEIADSDEDRVLESILDVADSKMTYRSRYLAAVNRAAALDLLLTDETNPRSLAYQLATIADHVSNLPQDESRPLGTPEERIASSLLHGIRMLDVDDLASASGGERTKLGSFLLRVASQLPKLSELVSHRYLIHAGVPRQMAEGRRE